LATIVAREPVGLATIALAAAGAAGFFTLGAMVDLSAGAGAVSLVAGAGVLADLVTFVIFFI
jgi:hypothetical protein